MGPVRIATRWIVAVTLALGAGLVATGQTVAQDEPACEARPTLITWDGDAGTTAWAEPLNWSEDTLPGPGSHACIAVAGTTVSLDSGFVASIASLQVMPGSGLAIAGNATLDLAGPDPSSLASLGVFGGTLTGAGTRIVTGAATLDTGTLTGTGRTVIGPGASLVIGSGQGGTLAIGGGHVLVVDAGATATWGPGPHDITLEAPSRIEVAGTLDIVNDRTLGGSGTLAVTGTLRKLSHGTTVIGGPLDLDGSLAVETGLLDAAAGDGGLGTDGSIVVGPGARLRLSGARTIGPAGSVTGAGILEVTTNGTLSAPATATWAVTTTYLTGNGSLTLDGERTLERLWLFGGSLAGSGARTVT
ncbi:MAG: hypothetical protein ABWZ82_07550, partial [Candidatus Limnocylindrales bacterium]